MLQKSVSDQNLGPLKIVQTLVTYNHQPMFRKRTFLFILIVSTVILVLGSIINLHLDLRLLALTPKIFKYRGLIQKYAVKENLDPRLVCALIVQESGFKENAQSRVGAQGLTQLMPATAKELGVEDPLDAEQNIAGAARYLHTLYHAFRESEGAHQHRLVLASYNGGIGRVRDAQSLVRHQKKRRSISMGTGAWCSRSIDAAACRYASRSVGNWCASARLF